MIGKKLLYVECVPEVGVENNFTALLKIKTGGIFFAWFGPSRLIREFWYYVDLSTRARRSTTYFFTAAPRSA